MSINRKILLVSPPATFLEDPAFVPHIGLLYISAALKSMKRDDSIYPQLKYIELADLNIDDADSKLFSLINSWQPGIVAFTATTPQYQSVQSFARKLKEKYSSIKLIIGGAHATNYSDSVSLSGLFDHIFVGESEDEIVKFWSHYISGTTTPLYEAQSGVDINRIVMPDWTIDGLNISSYSCTVDSKKALPILTSRGCRYSCAFCEKQPKGLRRERDIENIRTEIELIRKMGIEALVIYDCCLVTSMSRALQLQDLFADLNYEKTPIIWRAFMRADSTRDDVLPILKQAGCSEIGFGIESGSDIILQNINKKPCNRTINTAAIQACRKASIKAKAFLMVGLPGETKKTVDETINWVLEAEPDQIDVSLYMPYKGSDIGNHQERYDIKIYHPADDDFSKMFYKGSEFAESVSYVSIPSRRLSKGLSREGVYEQFKRLRNFKRKYNNLFSSFNKAVEEREFNEAIEAYKILTTLVIHEGELIWEQLKIFISTNSVLVIALGLFVRLLNPVPLVLIVGFLGILGCVVWYSIYKKSWNNLKIWFYLARKLEVMFRFNHIYSEGAIIRRGIEVNDFTEKNWKLKNLEVRSITTWMNIWILGFLVFWMLVVLAAFKFPQLLQALPYI